MPHQDNLFCCIFWRKVYLAVDPSATSPLIRQALHRNAFGGPTSIPKLITFHKRITKWIIKERLENCFSLSSILHAFQITQTWLLLNAILGYNHCNAFRCKWGQPWSLFFCFLISNPRTEKFTHILVEHKVFSLQNLKTFCSAASGDVLKCVFGLRGYEERIPSSIQQGMCVTYFCDYSVFDIDYKRPTTTTTISVRTSNTSF